MRYVVPERCSAPQSSRAPKSLLVLGIPSQIIFSGLNGCRWWCSLPGAYSMPGKFLAGGVGQNRRHSSGSEMYVVLVHGRCRKASLATPLYSPCRSSAATPWCRTVSSGVFRALLNSLFSAPHCPAGIADIRRLRLESRMYVCVSAPFTRLDRHTGLLFGSLESIHAAVRLLGSCTLSQIGKRRVSTLRAIAHKVLWSP